MSISISFMDLKLIDKLEKYNSIQLIQPSMDSLVKECLAEIGFDIRHEIQYIPSKHRSLGNKIGIDFVAVGEISRDKKFRHMFDALQRTVVAGMQDPSLGRELVSLMGKTRSYEPSDEAPKMSRKEKLYRIENDFDTEDDEDFLEYLEENYESDLKQIRQLEEIRDTIRANVKTGKGK